VNDRTPRHRRSAKHAGTSKASARKSSARKSSARSGRAANASGRQAKGKRTSRNTDERNPTRSGIEYPSRKYRRKDEAVAPAPAKRPSLRKREASRDEKPQPKTPATSVRKPRPTKRRAPAPARRRKVKTTEASEELARLAGRQAQKAQDQLARAAAAFSDGRERDALRLLKPLRDAYPDASAVRELTGLCHYRLGQYAAATRELEAFGALTDSVEQHPVRMDCARALGKPKKVEELWEELAAASPASAIVTEGRIVLAGSKADRGRLRDAIATLDRKMAEPKRVQEHHLRLWYALADLCERAGEIPRARELFLRIRRNDAGFGDVAERLAALG
jgi:tetratricopeptide (TPR) repeat protein